MTEHTFTQQIETAFQCLEEFRQQITDASGSPQMKVAESLEELPTVLAELQMAGEELLTRYQVLEAERQRYRDLFTFAPDSYLVTDVEGVIQESNRAAVTLFNRDLDLLRGKPLVHFVAREDRQPFHATLTRLQAGDVTGVKDWGLRVQPHAHPSFPATVSVAVAHDAGDQLSGLCWQLHDSTERKQAEEALMFAKQRAEEYLQLAGVMFIALDVNGQVTLANKKAGEILEWEAGDIVGRDWFDHCVPEGIRDDVRSVFRQLMRGAVEPTEYHENPVLTSSGQERMVGWHTTILRDKAGNIIGTLSSGEDITERKQVEQALTEERNLLRTLIDNLPDCIFVKDSESRFIIGNRAVAHVMGATAPDKLIGKTDFDFYPQELAAQYYADEKAVIQSGQPLLDREEPVKDAAGIMRWHSTIKAPLRDGQGKIVGLVGISRNITERKQAEEEKTQLLEAVSQQSNQLRAMTRRLAEVEEAERKQLAHELHDRVGSNLTALGLNLKIIRDQLLGPQSEAGLAHDRLDDSVTLVEETAERIRDVMANLRPPVLDDYGLVAALRWYGQRFAAWSNFTITVKGEDPDPRLAAPVENALFRIAQEALTNATRHAQATQVTMTLKVDRGLVRLVIADDGIGFDPTSLIETTERQGWGLLTMAERAEAVGGRCWVESSSGQGTRVVVEVV